jgi:hypothetical protein
MWTYAQKTGELLRDGELVATGYSGYDIGKNNPDLQAVAEVGPIPQGSWKIVGPPVNTPDRGPFMLDLIPAAETESFGRSGFSMHGDSIENPGNASHGDIVLPRYARELIWASGDTDLEVVSEAGGTSGTGPRLRSHI